MTMNAPNNVYSANVPTVSTVIGAGEDAHRIVRVGAWELVAAARDDEPRIRDIDLAERLGYVRPADVRDLVKRLLREGKLNDSEVLRTVRKTVSGGRPSTEFWLTEAQALKVVAKSETAKADALLDEVIRVFVLARRGLLPQQRGLTAPEVTAIVTTALAPLLGAVEALARAQAQQGERLAALEEKLATGMLGSGVVPGPVAANIRVVVYFEQKWPNLPTTVGLETTCAMALTVGNVTPTVSFAAVARRRTSWQFTDVVGRWSRSSAWANWRMCALSTVGSRTSRTVKPSMTAATSSWTTRARNGSITRLSCGPMMGLARLALPLRRSDRVRDAAFPAFPRGSCRGRIRGAAAISALGSERQHGCRGRGPRHEPSHARRSHRTARPPRSTVGNLVALGSAASEEAATRLTITDWPKYTTTNIRGRLRTIAKTYVAAGVGTYRSELLRATQKLRAAVHWAGTGAAWFNLPADRLGDTQRELAIMEREAKAVFERAAARRQLTLDDAKPN